MSLPNWRCKGWRCIVNWKFRLRPSRFGEALSNSMNRELVERTRGGAVSGEAIAEGWARYESIVSATRNASGKMSGKKRRPPSLPRSMFLAATAFWSTRGGIPEYDELVAHALGDLVANVILAKLWVKSWPGCRSLHVPPVLPTHFKQRMGDLAQ